MDPITLVGIVLTLVAIVVSMVLEHTSPMSIILIPPLVLVFVGTIGVTIAGGVMEDAVAMPKNLVAALKAKAVKPAASVSAIISLAEKARREGMLALEAELGSVDDQFLRRGLEMAVDGTDPSQIDDILSAEIASKQAADARKAKTFADMAGYAPTIGIIGTVIGLIHVLSNLGDPEELGAQIASAFVATLWGVLSANAFWMPIANRIKRISGAEVQQMELALEGVLAIQAGANPRLVARKLASLAPPPTGKEAAA